MLDYQENKQKNLIEFHISDKVTKDQVQEFLPRFQKALDEWEEVRLIEFVYGYEGIEAGAVWEDLKYVLKEFPTMNAKVSKCALVTDKKWVQNASRFLAPLFKTDMKYHDLTEEESAREWITQ